MLELTQIQKTYNPGSVREICLFDHFNLKVPSSQFISIVGSNGSGKTSMLNLLCGTIAPDGGKVIIDGKDITHLPEHLRYQKIGRIHQNPSMGSCSQMSILENMALADHKAERLSLARGISKKRLPYYQSLLKPLGLGLENMMNQKAGSLSGGQRQALALVMSLMADISILILDEHTASLDPKTADTIMRLTGEAIQEKKITALMVTHNLRYALEYGNRLVMMHQGGIVLDKEGDEKQSLHINDLLCLFNEISIECGN